MRKGLLIVIAVLCSVLAQAEGVGREAAMRTAAAFLQGKGLTMNRATIAARAPRRNAPDAACYYVFNADGGRGYVIVSGDDRTVPVLGYSLTGSYNPDSIPENMRAWLQGYADEIEALDEQKTSSAVTDRSSETKSGAPDDDMNVLAPAPYDSNRMNAPKAAISPLITSQWNQGRPYCMKCPVVGNYYCVSGCVATAMAQVMYYHRWPDAVAADIPSYTTQTLKLDIPEVSAGTPIEWDKMTDTYTNPTYPTAADWAVANLMSIVGTSVEMNYNTNESGALVSNIAPALIDYFDYDENLYLAERRNYTIAQWDDLLYNELVCHRPILYYGASTGGAHEFVVDGYDGDALYHVNWGWGGFCDGYFAISVLNPHSTEGIGASSSPDGYSINQNALIGVQSKGTETPIPPMPVRTYLMKSGLSVNGTAMSWSMYNMTGHEDSFYIGLTIVDMQTGESRTELLQIQEELGDGWGWRKFSYDVKKMKLSKGRYKVYPVSRTFSESAWQTNLDPSQVYVVADVSASGDVSLMVYSDVDLTATDIELPASPSVGNVQIIKTRITNKSNVEYNGTLYLLSQEVDGSEVKQPSATGVALVSGSSAVMEFSLTPERRVNHRLWIVTDYDVETSLFGNSIKLDESKVIGEALMIMGSQVPGDVDGDGRTGFEDVERLSRYVADGDESNIVKTNADVNGDGRIDAADVMEIIRMMTNGN
ncbi:MAG: C10 family peptidase [Prevotella sp.]|nr:C10 family peptidase [Prevotella sp.]